MVVFAHYIDERHIELDADVWGNLFKTAPIEVDYSRLQTLIVSDGALLPKDNPAIKALDPSEADRLRSEIRVEFNGQVVIKQAVDTYESTPQQVLAGHTNFGSLTAPDFTGRIVTFERLPIPRIAMIPGGMHAQIKVRFPSGRDGTNDPLLNASSGHDSCLLSITYVSKGRATLSLAGRDGAVRETSDVSFVPDMEHEIVIRPAAGKDSAHLAVSLACFLDGKPALGAVGFTPSVNIFVLQSGLNALELGGVAPRFTGQELTLAVMPDPGWLPAGQTWGMASLVVSFPLNKVGRHEPLLTSGITGAGDFIFVVYEDANHIRIGFDHWNGGGTVSDPIEIDYASAHEIWISEAPLYPEPGSAPRRSPC